MAAAVTSGLFRPYSRVLITSADAAFRKRMMNTPSYRDVSSEEATGGAQALAKLAAISYGSVVLDRNLPDLDFAEVAELIRRRYPEIEIEFVDSRVDQPFGPASAIIPPRFERSLEPNADEVEGLFGEGQRAESLEEPVEPLPRMIGSSRVMQDVYRLARMVSPRDTAVLITGETGTGKELVAQALHELSPRSAQPLVVVNCAAIPETLFEAELFGYTRGAFTGALQSRLGRIHVAQGGTLFLDEIGELPLSMQAKLLRFLQSGEVQRLGSSEVYKVDVRVVCATHGQLLDYVQTKQFRQDLYYRLAVFPIALPPLRQRKEDIEELSRHFLAELCCQNRVAAKRLTPATVSLLRQSRWDGNVRELQHAIERAFILSGNDRDLRVEHFRKFGRQPREI